MAIRDFFRNLFRKQKQLPSAPVQEEKEPDSINKLNVYAEKDGKETKRIIKIQINGTLIPIAEMNKKVDQVLPKDIVHLITRVLDSVQMNTDTETSLNYKKKQAIDRLEALKEHYGLTYLPELEVILDSYLPSQRIDYKKLKQMIPMVADISRMSESQVLDFGKILGERLNLLREIKTPEEAGANKEDIIHFMQSQETEDPLGMIIAANLENMNEENPQKLDLSTILACVKHLENFENEDAIMYSTYLKLEEKRILTRIQTEIEETRTEENSEQVDTLLADVEGLKIGAGETEAERKTSIMQYMMAIRNERDVARYVKESAKKDMQIRRYVLEEKTPHALEISSFFSSRIASLGQVTQIGGTADNGKVASLRKAIEESQFKDSDEKETDEFLLQVAEIEKDYIFRNYSALIDRYHAMTKTRKQEPELEEK